MGGGRTSSIGSGKTNIATKCEENDYINIPCVEEIVEAAPALAAETLQVMAPAINKSVISDRQTITNYMTEGGAIATTVAITTTITSTTIAVAITSPPKPVLLKIIGVGMGGTILGIALAILILRHYRKQVLHQRQ
ncbi:hypothetical protein DSM106972_048120 [Dulcicalothrix desertica PCC 7102]|uniref:Uncharacterized protein n=1 Tax=Dulcicalothrix desertica PCC 7102 TaxID=232991 RepID=A0A433VCV1_9CYAN|nr:hypothetical protein [Dulcicalothrix desertica]RUT03898.1 hypothetical protein DSM106972_048120 [Dulcicalothrix desertica PCC 7102]